MTVTMFLFRGLRELSPLLQRVSQWISHISIYIAPSSFFDHDLLRRMSVPECQRPRVYWRSFTADTLNCSTVGIEWVGEFWVWLIDNRLGVSLQTTSSACNVILCNHIVGSLILGLNTLSVLGLYLVYIYLLRFFPPPHLYSFLILFSFLSLLTALPTLFLLL